MSEALATESGEFTNTHLEQTHSEQTHSEQRHPEQAHSEQKDTEYKGNRSFSKKKYYELQEALEQRYGKDQSSEILQVFRDVFKFDPTVSVYTEAMKASIKTRRERLKEQGISTYISSGAKAYYDKKRQTTASS
jgi:hypothetical protein